MQSISTSQVKTIYPTKTTEAMQTTRVATQTDYLYSGEQNSSRIADLCSIRPKFRPLPGRVRRVPRSSLSHMLEQMSPIFIKLHCHYSVLPGFVAGTSDIRTTFISLHKWRKKLQLLISEVPGRKPGKTK